MTDATPFTAMTPPTVSVKVPAADAATAKEFTVEYIYGGKVLSVNVSLLPVQQAILVHQLLDNLSGSAAPAAAWQRYLPPLRDVSSGYRAALATRPFVCSVGATHLPGRGFQQSVSDCYAKAAEDATAAGIPWYTDGRHSVEEFNWYVSHGYYISSLSWDRT